MREDLALSVVEHVAVAGSFHRASVLWTCFIPCVPFFFKWLHPVGAKKHPYFMHLHLDNGEVDFLRVFG